MTHTKENKVREILLGIKHTQSDKVKLFKLKGLC
jgi:hypothetical protein